MRGYYKLYNRKHSRRRAKYAGYYWQYAMREVKSDLLCRHYILHGVVYVSESCKITYMRSAGVSGTSGNQLPNVKLRSGPAIDSLSCAIARRQASPSVTLSRSPSRGFTRATSVANALSSSCTSSGDRSFNTEHWESRQSRSPRAQENKLTRSSPTETSRVVPSSSWRRKYSENSPRTHVSSSIPSLHRVHRR